MWSSSARATTATNARGAGRTGRRGVKAPDRSAENLLPTKPPPGNFLLQAAARRLRSRLAEEVPEFGRQFIWGFFGDVMAPADDPSR
jgi:hypothetical protein